MALAFDTMRDGVGPGDLLPPGQTGLTEHLEAPVDNDGSFFDTQGRMAREIASNLPQNRIDRLHLMKPERIHALYSALSTLDTPFVRPTLLPSPGRTLSATIPTRPIDEVTGLPYCFVPNPNISPILSRNIHREADWDHQYTQSETRHGENPVLDLPFARYALMHLRLQWSTWQEHHGTWNFYDMAGPMQPATPQQLAATMLFGLSGYIPEMGIVITKKGPQYCRFTDQQRSLLSLSGQVMPQATDYPIAFLRWFVMQQEIDHIRDGEIGEFLETTDEERRIYLAHALAAKMVERAVAPFDATYVHLFQRREFNGMLVRRGKYVEHSRNPRDLLQTTILAKVGLRRLMQDLTTVFKSEGDEVAEVA